MEFEAYSDRPAPEPVVWPKLLLWLGVVTSALLILELTAQPALTIPLLCSKFGWSDFATACWLWRVDPNRRRGRVHFGLFLFAGAWKTAVAAGVVMIPLGLWLAEQPQPAQQGLMGQRLFWVFMTFVSGFLVAGLLALATFLLAVKYGVKVWLEATVHRARRENVWPPYCQKNHAAGIFLAALVPLLFLLAVIVLAIVAVWNNQAKVVNQDFVLVFTLLCIAIGVPILSLVLRDVIRRQVVARTPEECWDMA